ncbi:hypothetical protein [Streptomyces luteireticuli]|uniref:Uncharacterized protein n=1 Tax=Streptomyces luteireticuli TaxID=173858 RepID=A0ABN0Z4Q8_9ACTN
MSESSFEYRQARVAQGAACNDSRDLEQYLSRVGLDVHSLRQGLTEAVTRTLAGAAPPDEGTEDLPYPQDRVERALFDDMMGSTKQILVADPAVATALRHAMRLLADVADATHLVRALLERPDGGAAASRLSSLEAERSAG